MAHIRCQVVAQVAQDGQGRPYPTFLIPEPKSWERWFNETKEFRKVPRSEIGVNPEVVSPKQFDCIVLKRGGEPMELVMCEELHRHLSVDKKNLLIFGVEKIDEDGGQQKKALRA